MAKYQCDADNCGYETDVLSRWLHHKKVHWGITRDKELEATRKKKVEKVIQNPKRLRKWLWKDCAK